MIFYYDITSMCVFVSTLMYVQPTLFPPGIMYRKTLYRSNITQNKTYIQTNTMMIRTKNTTYCTPKDYHVRRGVYVYKYISLYGTRIKDDFHILLCDFRFEFFFFHLTFPSFASASSSQCVL